MKFTNILFTLFFLTILVTSCNKENFIFLDKEFELKYGEMVKIESEELTIEFLSIQKASLTCFSSACPNLKITLANGTQVTQVFDNLEAVIDKYNFQISTINVSYVNEDSNDIIDKKTRLRMKVSLQ